MSAHAILSASGAKRWMACTPSARFEEQFPESTSDFAEEGTAAHALAEIFLRDTQEGVGGGYLLFTEGNPHYDQTMEDYVLGYVDRVLERFAEARAKTPDAIMLLEQRLDFSEWVPEGFGTGDVVIIADGQLEIIDLKYGKGVPVEAEGNPQLRLYGLGAYNTFSLLFDIKSVRMTIDQPRLDSVTSCELLVEDLLEWAENEVKPKAADAWEGRGKYQPGDHCRFCRGKALCKARAEANLELAKYDFTDPNILMPDEIGEILGRLDELMNWAGTVKDYALEQAEKHGVRWPGWKLVEGRSNRKYSDQDAIASTLTGAGIEEALIYERSLLGITAMEKALGKKQFETLLGDLIIKPAGKPVLVPENDKRPEIGSVNSAKNDFAD